MMVNNVVITNESIEKTRQWFINNLLSCIIDTRIGTQFVNDVEKYTDDSLSQIVDFQRGENDHTFTFQQRAYYIQTGDSVPLLS
jgi:hypothetical protein